MRAAAGDRLVIVRSGLHEPVRDGEIIEVIGPDGTPPYLVRWADTGRTSLIYPGPDARVVHYEHPEDG
ncbi:Domain of unknown function DUF1918 [Thermomonospora curvata DSM 43183]|uniref:DUF1918 domain-containing protein n=2 Tax=Thermomonosporaceae TaxID=2012 RepID=D1ABP5_THECD|nr:Domain of unknown function DUF1918 [Thermomonospora curvata DSM 43183]PKK13252.1 MAG: DUF1918 domain-containing protein [Thermomonospora sp. CIF 1]